MKTNFPKTARALFSSAVLCVASAQAVVVGGINYVPTGATENLSAVFTAPTGGTTANNFHGLVQISVAGTGFSLSSNLNDAFYVYSPGAPFNDPSYYQLTFGTSPLVGLTPSQDAKHRIVYDLDATTEVTPTYVPAYQSGHVYNFILNTSLVAAGTLYFGVSDGNFADNGGQYNIAVTQLIPSASVPDTGTTALLMLGSSLGLYWLRRRVA